MNLKQAVLIALAIVVLGCKSDQQELSATPSVKIEATEVGSNYAKAIVTTSDATIAAWLCEPSSSGVPTATRVLTAGESITPNQEVVVCAEMLDSNSDYILTVAAFNDTLSSLAHTTITTLIDEENEGGNENGNENGNEGGNENGNEGGNENGNEGGNDDEEAVSLDIVFDLATALSGEEYTNAYLRLSDTESGGELVISLPGLPTGRVIAGEYHVEAENFQNRADMRYDAAESITATSGSVKIERDHDCFTLTILFEAKNFTLNATYQGQISGLDREEDDKDDKEEGDDDEGGDNGEASYWFTHAELHKEFISRYMELTLTSADESVVLYLEIYSYDNDLGYLVPGLYSVKDHGYKFEEGDIDYYYSTLRMNDRTEHLANGTLDVELQEECYTMDIDITDASLRTIKARYKGTIDIE